MIATGPPGGHFADATVDPAAGRPLRDRRRHRRVRQRQHHRARPDRRRTCSAPPRTGSPWSASPTPTWSARHRRVRLHRRGGGRQGRLRTRPAPCARRSPPPGLELPAPTASASTPDAAARSPQGAGARRRRRAGPRRRALGGSPRSVAFNAQWFRVAVDPAPARSGSCAACTAPTRATVMNPLQCRGQVEGGVAQALGATLAEHVDIDAEGRVSTAGFRSTTCRPFADVPRTEVHFADTDGRDRPAGRQVDEREPVQPGGARLANALRDATGVRFTDLPFTRDRVWRTNAHAHPRSKQCSSCDATGDLCLASAAVSSRHGRCGRPRARQPLS
jgi:hypothetical protein